MLQTFNRYHARRYVWMLLFTSSMVVAGSPQYLGLTLNVNTPEQVSKTLKARGATFSDNYGYKGYGKELPVYKIDHDPVLAKQGRVREAWLYFTPPPHKLYKIEATWADAGEVYQTLKDVLGEKYPYLGESGRGFVRVHRYRDDDVEILLTRNTFGFDEQQSTTLTYEYLPARPSVENMKAKIDEHIKQKRIENKGQDL